MNSTFKASKTTPSPRVGSSKGRVGLCGTENVHGGCAGKLGKNRACEKGLIFRYLRFGDGACTGGVW